MRHRDPRTGQLPRGRRAHRVEPAPICTYWGTLAREHEHEFGHNLGRAIPRAGFASGCAQRANRLAGCAANHELPELECLSPGLQRVGHIRQGGRHIRFDSIFDSGGHAFQGTCEGCGRACGNRKELHRSRPFLLRCGRSLFQNRVSVGPADAE
jgi:hypothetical protein